MKLKFLNKENKWKYSCFSKNSQLLFKDEGFGLKFAFEIYKIKLEENLLNEIKTKFSFYEKIQKEQNSLFDRHERKDLLKSIQKIISIEEMDVFKDILKTFDIQNNFESFIESYFNNKIGFPHYLECSLKIFNDYDDIEFDITESEIPFSDFISNKIISSKKQDSEIPVSIYFIIGEAGSGKTATQLFLAYQTKSKQSKLFEKNFIPCYLDLNSFKDLNYKKIPEKGFNYFEDTVKSISFPEINFYDMISESTGFKFNNKDLNFFKYSSPILFLLDLNALTSKVSLKASIPEENLCKFLNEFDRFSRKFDYKHKLIISYRGNHDLLKLQKNRLYEAMESLGIIFQIEPFSENIIEKYLLQIGGEQSIQLLKSFLLNASYLKRNPIILDFINWIALRKKDIGEIHSKAHLYLILTRELLRLQYKQWQKDNLFGINNFSDERLENRLLEFDENTFSEACQKPKYCLEGIAHPVDLILQIISTKLGENFTLFELEKTLPQILTNLLSEKHLNYEKSFTASNISRYTLFKAKESRDKRIEFFHSSFSDFYKAKALFYNSKTGELNKEIKVKLSNNYFSFELEELVESKFSKKESLNIVEYTKPLVFQELINLSQGFLSSGLVTTSLPFLSRALPIGGLIGGIVGGVIRKSSYSFPEKDSLIIKISNLKNLINKLNDIINLTENKHLKLKTTLDEITSFLNVIEKMLNNPLTLIIYQYLIEVCNKIISSKSNSIEKIKDYYDSFIARGMEKYHYKDYDGSINDLYRAVEVELYNIASLIIKTYIDKKLLK